MKGKNDNISDDILEEDKNLIMQLMKCEIEGELIMMEGYIHSIKLETKLKNKAEAEAISEIESKFI